MGVEDVEARALAELRKKIGKLGDGKQTVAKVNRIRDTLLREFDVMLKDVMQELVREMSAWDVPTSAFAETRKAIEQARTNLINDVKRYADGAGKDASKMAQSGLNLVDTSLLAIDRAVSLAQAEAVDVEDWLYSGPEDQANRDFCREHVGKRHTSKQVAALQNDVGPQPASLYGGGWNCRHRWLPLDKSELSQYPAWTG